MSNTLLPCPFCGREALMEARYVKDFNDAAIIAHYVRECHHCNATFARSFPSMKEADDAWNRRAILDGCENELIVRCKDCKHYNTLGHSKASDGAKA